MDERIKPLTKGAKSVFKKIDPLPHGFGIDCITVVIKGGVLLIWDFDADSGKCKEGIFLIPETTKDLLKKMMFHCGEEKVNSQLKNSVSYIG